MDTRLLTLLLLALGGLVVPEMALAQGVPVAGWQSPQWWRNGATLDLDFINDRYYLNGTAYAGLPGFFAGTGAPFTRASVATYYDSAGTLQTAAANVPRLDYDPATHTPKGILIEEARTNVLTYSEQFDHAPWGVNGVVVVANQAVAPSGTMTADRVARSDPTLNSRSVSQPFTATANLYSFSFWIKAGASSQATFGIYQGGAWMAQTASIVSGPGSVSGSGPVTITGLSGVAWTRVAVTTNAALAAGGATALIYPDGVFGGVGNDNYVWGAQVEAGGTVANSGLPTSYIPTTNVAVTRQGDLFRIPTAAGGGWFNATTGTFFAEHYGQYDSNNGSPAVGRIVAGVWPKAFIEFCGNLQCLSTWNAIKNLVKAGLPVTASPTQSFRSAMAWDGITSTRSLTACGLAPSTDSYAGSGDYTTTDVYVGSTANFPNASVKRVAFFPWRMSDAVLQDLTRGGY